jgi:4-azaleucine resistance transporter AzlC
MAGAHPGDPMTDPMTDPLMDPLSAARDGLWQEAALGVRAILPALLAAVPIAVLFGALCAGKGLSVAEVELMSGLVFAGGAQFAAVEIWRASPPIAILAFSTLLINARHILMGASLAPKTGLFSPLQRSLLFFFLADENWAMAERRAAQQPLTPTYFLAMSSVFWLNWVIFSSLGGAIGAIFGDPKHLGADFAFSALFIGLVAGFWKGRSTAVTVLASCAASGLAYVTFGPPWHVAVGAICGIGAAYALAPVDRR